MLSLENVAQAYGRKQVLNNVSFRLAAGAIGCLLGPSGCGKTTALRLIAGFETLQSGRILLEGQEVAGPNLILPPEKRRLGLVFQDYALFPHLSVADNVGFGLAALPRPQRQARVEEMLQLVGLDQEGRQYPHQLSGGQQQRVALARALAPRPRLLLLDEPFSNLDVELREKLSIEVRDILKHEGITALLVTHDQNEAFAMADQVGVMEAGVIQQWDTPYALYHRPRNRFVANFIGQGVLLSGVVRSAHQVAIELGLLQDVDAAECDAGSCLAFGIDAPVEVLIRPDDILHDDASPLQAEVERRAFRGADFLYTLRLPSGARVLSQVPSHHDHAIGERIGIRLDVDHVVAFGKHPPSAAKTGS